MTLAVRHARWRARDIGSGPVVRRPSISRGAAIVSRELARDQEWLSPESVARLLDCYGLPLIDTRVVKHAEQAVAVAHELGSPVALKAIAPGLIHKTDAGGSGSALTGPTRCAPPRIEQATARGGHRLDGLVV